MPDIHGIIFDLDGVIADTAEFHYQSWQRLADEEDVAFDREDNEELRGVTRDVSLRRFTDGLELTDEERQDWFQRKDTYFQEQMNQLHPGDELAGVLDILDSAAAAGLLVGVGSASRNARPVLEKLNLIDRFVAVGDGYTVVNSKPAPDIFLWVAGAMGISPAQILVLEDSKAGVEAALRGGFYVIGVGNAAGYGAHANLPDLAGQTAQSLIALLEEA